MNTRILRTGVERYNILYTCNVYYTKGIWTAAVAVVGVVIRQGTKREMAQVNGKVLDFLWRSDSSSGSGVYEFVLTRMRCPCVCVVHIHYTCIRFRCECVRSHVLLRLCLCGGVLRV